MINPTTFDPSALCEAMQGQTTGDPVDNFFEQLPPPEKDYPPMVSREIPGRVQNACAMFSVESMLRQSTDPDADYVLEHARKALGDAEGKGLKHNYQQLVLLALNGHIPDNDDSLEARYLRFCRWIVQGRKDETAHFGPGSDVSPGPSVSKTLLPISPAFGQCAECGKQGANEQCAGCLVRNDSHTTFATTYCSRECQQKHRKTHRSLCMEMQQIHRAASVFQDIFEHFLTLTFPNHQVPKQITEENGMVVVKFESPRTTSPFRDRAMAQFPLELAPSPDLGRAALMHSRCGDPLSYARTLFEMLIRPSCANIQNIGFEPKNMHKPVHITRADWDEHNALMIHEITIATLSCGMAVAIDPTGIQYGWKENISPWSHYKEHRVNYICDDAKDLHPHSAGLYDLDRLGLCGLRDVFPTDMTSTETNEQLLMETVVSSLTSQITRRYGGGKGFLQLKDSEFTRARIAVVKAAERGLTMLAGEIRNSAQPRILVLRHPGPGGSYKDEKEIIWCKTQHANIAIERQHQLWKSRWDQVVTIRLPSA